MPSLIRSKPRRSLRGLGDSPGDATDGFPMKYWESSLTISAKPVGVGAASQPLIVAGERPFSARCYSLISLSVPSSAARLAASR